MAPRVENEQQEQDSFGSCISDSESMTSEFDFGSSRSGGNLMRLSEEDEEHILLKHKLYSSLKSSAKYCTVVAAYKNMNSSDSTKSRLEAFRFYCESMADKRGGQQNIKPAWYGTSKDGINQIICHGFDICEATEDSGLYGHGLYLSPDNCAIDSVVSAVVDKDGLRHVLFCSVILGNIEEVLLGSGQAYPSSEEFNSGVDNKQFPKRYIIWPSYAKTHIWPLYVVSIRLDFSSKGLQTDLVKRPTSPWIPLSALITILAACLPYPSACLIKKYHNAYTENKITREQLTFLLRHLSGDKLLIGAIKTFQTRLRKRLLSLC